MEISEILSKCDHTLLTQTATWADIKGICDDGMKYHTASVCIPASFVRHKMRTAACGQNRQKRFNFFVKNA